MHNFVSCYLYNYYKEILMNIHSHVCNKPINFHSYGVKYSNDIFSAVSYIVMQVSIIKFQRVGRLIKSKKQVFRL